MTLPVPDKRATLGAAADSVARFTAALRDVADPTATAIGHWSIGDTAAHMSHGCRVLDALMEGGTSPVGDHRQMGASWERELEKDPERNPNVLADRIDTSSKSAIEKMSAADWEALQPWHAGLEVPTCTLATILLNETEIHGLDIATAENKQWRTPVHHARLIIEGLLPILPHFVRRESAEGLEAIFELDIRGGNRIYFSVSGGELAVSSERPGAPDCKIKADPLAYLLVGYGRQGQWGPLLTGKIIAYGRKPWLGLRFAKLFVSP